MLFRPLALGGLALSNRIAVSPMGQYSARDGCATDWHVMHLGHLAVSGAGLLIAEAAAIHPDGRGSATDLGIWSDAQAAALEPVFAFCRRHGGAKLGMQIYHSGRKGSITSAWEGQQYVPPELGGWRTCAPSAIAYPGRGVPIELDRRGMDGLVAQFIDAARRIDGLGVDLLEMHAAHGYLLHQFLSPLTNRRDDEYGGPNRMRFPLEVFEAIRRVWPERKALGVRISATDWVEGGWDMDDSVRFCAALRERGCDYIAVSSGGTVPEQQPKIYPGYQVGFAERIRREAGIPTMAIGLITEPRQADAILRSGQADMVALARAMLYNPRWPWHAAVELGEKFFCPPQYLRSHPSLRDMDFLRPAPTRQGAGG
ncbi:MAG: NADH:flavin oxidoreductase/NADH oxidase [Reyranellaceae bacterium]